MVAENTTNRFVKQSESVLCLNLYIIQTIDGIRLVSILFSTC